MTTATTHRAPGRLQRQRRCGARLCSARAAGPSCAHTAPRYHRLPSPTCALCNRLACSVIVLQLITWAANSGQLCLKKIPPSKPVLKISHSSNSQAALNTSTTQLSEQNRERVTIYFPINLRTLLGGKLGTSRWRAHFTTVPFALISFPPPTGLRPEKGASNKERQTVRQSYNVRKCIWLFFFSLFKISAYKYS